MKELYLILDAKTAYNELFIQAKEALMGGVDKIQLSNADIYSRIQIAHLIELCHNYQSVLLFHESLDYAIKNNCDGVHFDNLPDGMTRENLPNNFIIGVTVGNDEKDIQHAIELGVDYISFCSIYPTESAPNCELIDSKIIYQTAKKYKIPIYVAGGIKINHLDQLNDWPIAGVAIISDILEAEDITNYVKKIMKKLTYDAK